MAKIENINSVVSVLTSRINQAKEDNRVSVIVGYSSKYALFVHENLEQRLKGTNRPSGLGVYWGPNGGPKFLEEPARTFQKEIANIITTALKKGVKMLQALFMGGLRLQRESMLRVPVEYGFLKNSAFTREEK